MPKHVEKIMVVDLRLNIQRGVTVEVSAPQFILDCMEAGNLSIELAAQEAFEIVVKVPKRG